MTDNLQLMDALSQLAAENMPTLKAVYLDLQPKNIERPCLLIEAVTETVKPAAAALVQITSYFTLTIFDATDHYAHSDTRRLIELRTALLRLFRGGGLAVGNRVLSVKASTGGRDWDKAYIDLQIEYLDDRSDAVKPLPLMQTVETDITTR